MGFSSLVSCLVVGVRLIVIYPKKESPKIAIPVKYLNKKWRRDN